VLGLAVATLLLVVACVLIGLWLGARLFGSP